MNTPGKGRPLHGKTVLISGASAGIGFFTAKALASHGARVLITGRDETRGRKAVEELRRRSGHDQVDFLAVDHSTIGGNQRLAAHVLATCDRLDVLVNNVGGLYAPRRETRDGYEATLAMNLLGPHALTDRLLPLLGRSAPARIVNLVSDAYRIWRRDPLDDLQSAARYVGIEAYGHAKLLNLLWTFALARRLAGSGVVANATNPGTAWTPLTQSLTREAVPVWRLFWPVVRWAQRRASPEKAARSSVHLAASPEAASVTGTFYDSRSRQKRPAAMALDVGNQERVWEIATALVAKAPTALGVEPTTRVSEERGDVTP